MNTFLPAGLVMILLSCNGLPQTDSVKNFIPGTYCAEWENEFKKATDTIEIQLLTQNGSESYRISRRVHLTFVNQLKATPSEYKAQSWTGTYSKNSKTVIINNTGSILSFDPVKKILWWGTSSYKKL